MFYIMNRMNSKIYIYWLQGSFLPGLKIYNLVVLRQCMLQNTDPLFIRIENLTNWFLKVFSKKLKFSWSLYLCNLMVETFDISNLNGLAWQNSLFKISKVNNIRAHDLKNSGKYGSGLSCRWALFIAWAFGFKLHLNFHRVEWHNLSSELGRRLGFEFGFKESRLEPKFLNRRLRFRKEGL